MVLAAAVGLIAVVAVVSVIVGATREAVELDRATPSGVVQAYLAAVAGSDLAEAAEYLAADSSCGVDELARAYVPEPLQAELVSDSVAGDTAVVTVSITEGTGVGLFEPSGYSRTERFVLTRQADGWRLTGTPWPMYECGGRFR